MLENKSLEPNLQDENGDTPLHLAVKNNHITIIEKLLENNSLDLNLQNKDGETPLHIAAQNGYTEITEKLLKNNSVDSNLQDIIGENPLHAAAEHGWIKIVEKLLESSSADPNLQNKIGETPLQLATQNGHMEIVAKLLENNSVDPNLKNRENKTAFNLAIQEKYWNIAITLIDHNTEIENLNDDEIKLLKKHLQNNFYANKNTILNKIAEYSQYLQKTKPENPNVQHHCPQNNSHHSEVPTSSASSHQPYPSTLYKAVTTLLAGVHWKWPALYPSWRTTVPPSNPLTLNLDSGQPTAAQHSNSLQNYHSGDLQGLLLLVDLAVKKWMGRQHDQPSATRTNALPQAAARLQILLQQQCGGFSSGGNLEGHYNGYRADTPLNFSLPASVCKSMEDTFSH